MWIGLGCVLSVLVLVGVVVLSFRVMFSPVRAVLEPCSLTDLPATSPPTAQRAAVEALGFPVFEPFGVRALMRSFEALGFQPSGAVKIRNPPVPEMYVALLTRRDADVRLWVQPDGTPGTAAVCSVTEGVRVVTSGSPDAATLHDREEVESFPDASPMALVHRHEERMKGRPPPEHTPDGAFQRYLDEWADDLAAMKRKSLLARAISWFSRGRG